MVLEGETFYAFYSDEPMAETDNPFILMYMQFGWVFNDVTGGPPKLTLIVIKLDPESAAMAADLSVSEESARKYADEFNLTMKIIDGIPVFGYEPVKPKPFPLSPPIGVVHFYINGLFYQIRTSLSFEEMVEIARSIIEQL